MHFVLSQPKQSVSYSHTGLVSNYMGLPLTVWIAIQITYTFLGVYAPTYFQQLKKKKWQRRFLHCISLFAGVVLFIVPSLFTVGLGGFSPQSTKFPSVACFAINRELNIYIFIVPVQILLAIVVTELVLILHSLFRY